MKFSTRELATMAVFGALWGMVEVSLGSVLKSLQIPLSGAVLAAIGCVILLTARRFVPRRGSTLFIGVIAMFLKLFSLGGVVVGPIVGILFEALIAEAGLSLSARPRRLAFVVISALVVVFTMLQPFITGPLLFGRTLFVVWLDLVDMAGRLLGIGAAAIWWGVLFLALIHLAIGGLAGWMAWDIARILQVRLGRAEAPALMTVLVLGLLLSACASPAAPAAPAAEGGVGEQSGLLLSGPAGSKTYTRANLEALPIVEESFKDVTYRGVSLAVLLQNAGYDPAAVKAIKAVASDGFTVNYDSSQFLSEDFIIAYATKTGDLTTEDGAFRVVLPGAEGKLNVRMLAELQVIQ